MNRFVLIWLSFSSMTAMLVSSFPVHAEPQGLTCRAEFVSDFIEAEAAKQFSGRELEFTAPDYDLSSDTLLAYNPEEDDFDYPEGLLFDDELGDLAVKYCGCDCAGCRYRVSMMLKSGALEGETQRSETPAMVETAQAAPKFRCDRLA